MSRSEYGKRMERLSKLAFELAVESAWCVIEGSSTTKSAEGHEWMSASDVLYSFEREFELLTGLGIAVVHPDHPEWIRRIDPPSAAAV